MIDDYKEHFSRPFPYKKKEKRDDKGKIYWGDIQQWAVMEYKGSDHYPYRNIVFTKFLYEAVKHMSEAILGRYPIYKGRYSDNELTRMAITELVEKFENFDEWKPDPFHKQIPYMDFTEDMEYDVQIDIESNGVISNISSNSELPKSFVDLLIEDIIGKKKTIYSDTTIDTRIKFRCAPKKKFVYFYTPYNNYNDKIAKEYYLKKYPTISQTDLNKRVDNLREYLYFDIEKERSSYSYCQTIIRNYYKGHSQRHNKTKLNKLPYAYAEQETDSMQTSGDAEKRYFTSEDGNKELFNQFLDYYSSIIKLHKANNPYFDDNRHKIAMAIEKIIEDWDIIVPDQDEKGEVIKDTARKNLFIAAICDYTGLGKYTVKNELKYFLKIYYDAKADFFENYAEI